MKQTLLFALVLVMALVGMAAGGGAQALDDPDFAQVVRAGDYATTSHEFVQVGEDLTLAIVTDGGDVDVYYSLSCYTQGDGIVGFDFALDGVLFTQRAGLLTTWGSTFAALTDGEPMAFSFGPVRLEDVPAGDHTLTLHWRTSAGRVVTSWQDTIVFSAREID